MSSSGREPPAGERHQPLPGVLKLPGYLYRRLSRRARMLVALALAVAVAAVGVSVPLLLDAKREREARERVEERQRQAERREEVIALQRPRYGRSPSKGRAATIEAINGAIVTDVARRVRSGEVETPAKRSECEKAGLQERPGKTLMFCTAVTSDIEASEFSTGASVGYLYRALADPRTGRFAFCKVIGQAGEGSYTRRPPPPLSPDCGG